jgi:hypothetical protein
MLNIQLSYVKYQNDNAILFIACSELIYIKRLEITKLNAIVYKLTIMNIDFMNCTLTIAALTQLTH